MGNKNPQVRIGSRKDAPSAHTGLGRPPSPAREPGPDVLEAELAAPVNPEPRPDARTPGPGGAPRQPLQVRCSAPARTEGSSRWVLVGKRLGRRSRRPEEPREPAPRGLALLRSLRGGLPRAPGLGSGTGSALPELPGAWGSGRAAFPPGPKLRLRPPRLGPRPPLPAGGVSPPPPQPAAHPPAS